MISVDELRKMLREACEAAGSQKAWAAANGVSTAYVSDVLAGRRDPGEGIAKAFGLKPTTVYVPLSPPEQQATKLVLAEARRRLVSRRERRKDKGE